MKNFPSFFQLLAFVVFCFASNYVVAQINALPGSYLTTNQYTSVEIAGYGNNVVVVSKKSGENNSYRLASYGVTSTGAVTLKDTKDFISWNMPAITKLSETRLAMVTNGNENTTAKIYDINASGVLTLKGSVDIVPMVSWNVESIIRLTNSSFAVAYTVDGKIRLYTLAVNASGSSVTVKDEDQFAVASLQSVKLTRMSDTRIVAAGLLSYSAMKLVCYDINATTGTIVRKGDYPWTWTTKRVSMTAFSENKLACFTNDNSDRLDVVTFEISATGNFTQKFSYLDMVIPGTSTFYTFKSIDSQYDSGVSKIHLCGVRTTDKLNIVPFTFATNGSLTITPSSQHYLSTATFTETSASAAAGNVVASSIQADGKYRIQAFKWGN
jgi:hypothetical protein